MKITKIKLNFIPNIYYEKFVYIPVLKPGFQLHFASWWTFEK